MQGGEGWKAEEREETKREERRGEERRAGEKTAARRLAVLGLAREEPLPCAAMTMPLHPNGTSGPSLMAKPALPLATVGPWHSFARFVISTQSTITSREIPNARLLFATRKLKERGAMARCI